MIEIINFAKINFALNFCLRGPNSVNPPSIQREQFNIHHRDPNNFEFNYQLQLCLREFTKKN